MKCQMCGHKITKQGYYSKASHFKDCRVRESMNFRAGYPKSC